MPALEMKRKFNDAGFVGEFDGCSKSTKSPKCSQSQVCTVQQSVVLNSREETSQDEAHCTTQVAGQDYGIAEACDFQDACNETSSNLFKAVTSGASSPPNLETVFLPNYERSNYQSDLVNYVNEDVDGNPDSPLLFAVNNHEESWDSSQTCSLLDIFSPEEAFPFSFDTSMALLTNFTSLYNDYAPMDTMINVAESVVLPFVEKTMGSSIGFDEVASFGGNMCFNNSEVLEWLNQHLSVEDLPGLTDLTEANSSVNPAWLPKAQEAKTVTLVLDLDETLVHSALEHCDDADFTFSVFFNMKEHTVYVRKRPYLHMFLEKVAEMFEIVIFTASQSIYAEKLLDILDPERKLISKRFFRESCIFTDGSCSKDLTILGVDLAKVAIIDNSPQVFRLQVNNGIPIESWFDNSSDDALIQLLPFLETLAIAEDVRPIIEEKFGNKDSQCVGK